MEETDRRREDQWFRENAQRLIGEGRLARERRTRERAERERAEEGQRLKELHFMKCPKCGHGMKEEDLDGVKVDRCGFCEGIYLDPGELEQVFARRDQDRSLFRKLLRI